MAYQKLVFPIEKAKITAGYMAKMYKEKHGYNHYGVDMICVNDEDYTVYACGNGTVITAGNDVGLGYITVIRYDNVVIGTGTVSDVIATTFHHEAGSIKVKAGDKVNANTIIARYGKTGYGIEGEHLHIQFDTDVSNPLYCTGINGSGSIILKRGTVDSTINPVLILNNYEGTNREWRGEMVHWHDDYTSDEMSLWTDLDFVTPELQDTSKDDSEVENPDIPSDTDKNKIYKNALKEIRAILDEIDI